MQPLISIIIVNYNTAAMLDDCIASVYEKTEKIDYEVIIVDNASEQGSISSLVEKYPSVRFVFSPDNLGFGRANNLGAIYAVGKYLFFLNPDTLLINNAVKELCDFMESNPDAGICGGNMYKRDMTPASSYYDTDFLLYEYKIIFSIRRPTGFNHTGVPKSVNVIVGADLFMPKIVFERVGGFDPDFFMYFDEVELCDRVRKAGYKIVSVPDAEIIHLQGGAAENKSDELARWSYQEHWYSKLVYFSKTKGRFHTALLYRVTMLKLNWAYLVYSLMKNKERIDYWQKKKEVMHKTWERYKSYLDNK